MNARKTTTTKTHGWDNVHQAAILYNNYRVASLDYVKCYNYVVKNRTYAACFLINCFSKYFYNSKYKFVYLNNLNNQVTYEICTHMNSHEIKILSQLEIIITFNSVGSYRYYRLQ